MEKKISRIYVVYTIVSFVSLLISFPLNHPLKELQVMGRSINIELWMLSFLVLLTSAVSFVAVRKLHECKKILKKEAKKVGIEDSMLKNNDELIETISQNPAFYVVLGVSSIFAGICIVNTAALALVRFSKIYAYVLVIFFVFYNSVCVHLLFYNPNLYS